MREQGERGGQSTQHLEASRLGSCILSSCIICSNPPTSNSRQIENTEELLPPEPPDLPDPLEQQKEVLSKA